MSSKLDNFSIIDVDRFLYYEIQKPNCQAQMTGFLLTIRLACEFGFNDLHSLAAFLYSFKEQPGQPLSVHRIWAKGGGKSILEHLREAGSPASD